MPTIETQNLNEVFGNRFTVVSELQLPLGTNVLWMQDFNVDADLDPRTFPSQVVSFLKGMYGQDQFERIEVILDQIGWANMGTNEEPSMVVVLRFEDER